MTPHEPPTQHRLRVLLRDRAGLPLTPVEQAAYGQELAACAQELDGTCARAGSEACDRRCPFRWLD